VRSKWFIYVIGVLVATVGLVGLVERSRWIREKDALCAGAKPLVDRRAPKDDVFRLLGQTDEHRASELASLEAAFDRASPKAESLRHQLQGSDTVLVYSQSNSIMFVFLDRGVTARSAECFLQ
jgi:hypothetical protein